MYRPAPRTAQSDQHPPSRRRPDGRLPERAGPPRSTAAARSEVGPGLLPRFRGGGPEAGGDGRGPSLGFPSRSRPCSGMAPSTTRRQRGRALDAEPVGGPRPRSAKNPTPGPAERADDPRRLEEASETAVSAECGRPNGDEPGPLPSGARAPRLEGSRTPENASRRPGPWNFSNRPARKKALVPNPSLALPRGRSHRHLGGSASPTLTMKILWADLRINDFFGEAFSPARLRETPPRIGRTTARNSNL